jgi:hypothetical protein
MTIILSNSRSRFAMFECLKTLSTFEGIVLKPRGKVSSLVWQCLGALVFLGILELVHIFAIGCLWG